MVLFSALVNHRIRKDASEFHYELKLFLLIVAWEYRLAGIKFSHDAAKRPYVDFLGVRDPQNYLWSSIEAGLNVCIHLLFSETT